MSDGKTSLAARVFSACLPRQVSACVPSCCYLPNFCSSCPCERSFFGVHVLMHDATFGVNCIASQRLQVRAWVGVVFLGAAETMTMGQKCVCIHSQVMTRRKKAWLRPIPRKDFTPTVHSKVRNCIILLYWACEPFFVLSCNSCNCRKAMLFSYIMRILQHDDEEACISREYSLKRGVHL